MNNKIKELEFAPILTKENDDFEKNSGYDEKEEEFDSDEANNQEKGWKPKSLIIDTTNIELQDICRRLDDEDWNISPEFQRNFVWSILNGAKFIESLLINITIPPVYLFETTNSKFDVIDGVQRLTTIQTFLHNEWKLRGLESFENLNGKKFEELNIGVQNYLKTQVLQTIRIRKGSDESLKFDIFSRLNQGSMKLNTQELRNAIYRSDLNSKIKKFTNDNLEWKVFENLTLNSVFVKRMKNTELIFRYLSFYEKIRLSRNNFNEISIKILDYNGRIIYLINNYMKLASKNSIEKNEQIINDLNKLMYKLKEYFDGIKIFRIYSNSKNENFFNFDNKINISLAEATLILFKYLDFEKISKQQFQEIYKSLFINDKEKKFFLSLKIGTGNNNQLMLKYTKIFTAFSDYLII